ncbi:MAG: ABC transporter substrate-binding protein, partial [Actinomycetota bacterium]
GGLGEPGNPGFLPTDHPFHVKVEQYEFNRRAANRLLDEAGYKRGAGGIRTGPDGKPLNFEMAVVPEVAPTVEVVIEQLKALGIAIKLQPVDLFLLFSGKVKTPMTLQPHGGMRGDPDFMRVVFSSRYEKRFFAPKGYTNAELDDLADRQQQTLDEGQRKQMVARMQEIVAADLPYLHLYYPRPYTVFRKEVFDQWTSAQAAGPSSKDTYVTGTKAGGTEIRPIREG